MLINKYLESLIDKKWYKNKEEAINKAQIFFAHDDITEEQYVNLKQKAEKNYKEK